MWCIGELGLDYERIDAGFTYGGVDTPDYRAMNPNGTVPTIRDGDHPPLWETGAILRYVANTYAPESFWPGEPSARAKVDQWAEWSKINIAMNFTAPVFWHVVRTPPSKQDPATLQRALRVFHQFLDIAEAQLAAFPYLAGEHFTLADIQFGHCLYRYFDIHIKHPSHTNIRRYFDELTTRPSFAEHVMLS